MTLKEFTERLKNFRDQKDNIGENTVLVIFPYYKNGFCYGKPTLDLNMTKNILSLQADIDATLMEETISLNKMINILEEDEEAKQYPDATLVDEFGDLIDISLVAPKQLPYNVLIQINYPVNEEE